MEGRGLFLVVEPLEEPAGKEKPSLHTNISLENIVKTVRRRQPPARVSVSALVQTSVPSPKGKKKADVHLDMPMTERNSERNWQELPDEFESGIVVERTPKRTKTKSRFREAANPVKELVFHTSEINKLERSKGQDVTGGEATTDCVSFDENSSLGFSQGNGSSPWRSTLQSNKTSSDLSTTQNVTSGLINATDTLDAPSQESSICAVVVDGAVSTSAVDKGAPARFATSATSFNQELGQNNSARSIAQRLRQTPPSSGFHSQSSLGGSQYTSHLLDQPTPQRPLQSSSQPTTLLRSLQSSFHQSTDSLRHNSSILQTQESSMILPSTPPFSGTLLGLSNSASYLSDSKSIATSQVNPSTSGQQDQRAYNPSITYIEDMVDGNTPRGRAIELDGDSNSGLSDLDPRYDFTEFEDALNLNSPESEPPAEQEPRTPSAKSRPTREKRPTSKALQKQQNQTPKKSRARGSKEKNVLQKASARAKAVTKKVLAKPKLPKAAAARASARKNKVDEGEQDDYHPENDLGFAIPELGVSLRDRSKLKAPATLIDEAIATVDLVQSPGAKNTEKNGETRATKASPIPSSSRAPSQKKATASTPRTPKQSKKSPPKSNKFPEPKLSPHDSGFSEVASTDDEQVQSDFAPPSSSSSGSPQASSIISPSSPEEDAEDDIVEPSSPEAAPQRERKHHTYFATNITIEDADARTDPPLGPELLMLAKEAYSKGQIARVWNPEAARRVDGIWMAPEMCNSCRDDIRSSCDRTFPCAPCVRRGKHCNMGEKMTRTACNNNSRDDGATTPLHLNAPIVSQNGDETWNVTIQAPPTTRPKKRKRVDTSKEIAKSQARRAVTKSCDKRLDNASSRFGEVSQHLKARHTFRNGDATWNITEQALPANSIDKRKRKYAGTSEAIGSLSAKKQQRLPAPRYPSSETDIENHANARQALGRSKTSRTYIAYHRSEQEHLPTPYGKPPVWAEKRQQLCEALPYYRAYMSGGYLHDGLVRAFLIDKEVRDRDVFDEEIVITRCGGGRTLDEATNKMIQTTHQERSAYGLGFERARDMRSPVAIIAGQGNPKSPSKLPHYYNVLDWFHVTDVWVEKVEGFKTWCVRLEKIRLDEKSWWATAGSTLPSQSRDLNAIRAALGRCLHCGNISKVIFEQGWACLKASCDKFFDFGSSVDDPKLIYTEAFLKERTAYPGNTPGPLAPPLVTEADMIIAGQTGTEAAFKQGIVCPMCKGCSRRTKWSNWSCETEGCGFTHSLPFRIMSVKDTMADIVHSSPQHNYARDFGVKYEEKRIGAYNVFEYGVPGPDGKTVGVLQLFKSTDAINHQPEGPNDLFRLMQESDFDLRRRPVRQPNSSGEILTNHFATNWGAPYKFVVTQSSRGFSEAPTVIVKALKRLTWAGEQAVTAVGESFHPFNELLSIGYFEDSSIGFHDDGESTLGPTVATLSLGASATMSLRPKAKAAIGVASRNAKGTKSSVLRMTLEHGDIVIMHGSGVQKYYEHEVVPSGTLRFALTCRYVRPETLESDAEREDARMKGALPEGHEQYRYEGDEDPIFTPEEMKKSEKEARLNALMRSLNDAAAICKASESQGDDDECCQMRYIMNQFKDEAPARKESREGVDAPMLGAS